MSDARFSELRTRTSRLFDTTAAGSVTFSSASRTPLIGASDCASAISMLCSMVSMKLAGISTPKRASMPVRKRDVCWPNADFAAASKSRFGNVADSVSSSTRSAMTSLSTSTPSQSQMR